MIGYAWGQKRNRACHSHRELIKVQDQYIQLLGQELNELVPLASNRGWKSSRLEKGKVLRDRIEELEEQL